MTRIRHLFEHGRSRKSCGAKLLSVLAVFSLGGCATAPDTAEAPAIDMPGTWSATAVNEAPPGPWLDDFKSSQLKAFLAEALAHNAELGRVTAVLGQSIAEARIAGADLMPSTNLGLNSSRQKISTFGPRSVGGEIFENHELGLDLQWEVDLWGRLRDMTSAALGRVAASQAELEAARLSLAGQVTQRWLNWIEARQHLEETRRTATAYRENLRSLESRYKRGLSEGIDLRRIRNLSAAAEADLAERQRSLDTAARSLEVLLGRYPGADPGDPPPGLPALPAPIPAGIPADLIQRRPDLIAAERRLAAADKELLARKKDLLPRISLTGSGGTSSQQFDNLLDGDFSVWSLAGNLTQPVFQGGRILANIDRSASLRDQARAAYRNAALQAFLEVETTLAAESYLKDQYAQLERAAEEANAVEKDSWKRYREGTGDFIEALDAQRSAAGARSRLIAVRKLLLQNRIDLYLALGGPFTLQS